MTFTFRLSFLDFCLIIFVLVIQHGRIVDSSNSKEMHSVDRMFQLLQNQINSLRTDLGVERGRRISLEKVMDKGRPACEDNSEAVNEQKVAFYAKVSPSLTDIQPWATLVFSLVETNDGEAYNSSSGQFVAPINGTYAFFSNILSASGEYIETCLQVNGEIRMYMYSGSNYHGSGSNMAVLKLKVGDTVNMAKHGPWGSQPHYVHHLWSTFSGYLLYTD